MSVYVEYNHYQSFEDLADEEIVEYAREGDTVALEYLIHKYKNFVRGESALVFSDRRGSRGYHPGRDDRSLQGDPRFRADKLASFRAFAELCITRQIITAIKTATRQKHIPLNSYVSLNKPLYDDESDRTLEDVLAGNKVTDPEELVISREEFLDIESKMSEFLSDLEWSVLMLYLEGKSYQEIADQLSRHVKSIDNALQRVKRKLERYLEKRESEMYR